MKNIVVPFILSLLLASSCATLTTQTSTTPETSEQRKNRLTLECSFRCSFNDSGFSKLRKVGDTYVCECSYSPIMY